MTYNVPIEAFMGGIGIGLATIFTCLLLTLGADIIRTMLSD